MTPGNAVLSVVTGSDNKMLPFPFLLDLSLTQMAYQWVKTLGDDDTTRSGLHPRPHSLMMLFENQVAAMRLQYPITWPKRHELMLCAIQLQIYSFAIRVDPSRAGTPDQEVMIKHDEVRHKAIAVLVDLARHVSDVTTERYKWPVFPRLHLGRAIAIGIYLAATTSDNPIRMTILQACKKIVQMLAGYAQYPKELTARVTKHFAAGIRTIEAQGLEWFQTVETADTRPPISARMSANTPYQIIWWAKHSPRIVPEPEQVTSVLSTVVPIAPSSRKPGQPDQSHLYHLPQADVFGHAADLSFFPVGDLDFDLDFTDIHLDWQWLNEELVQSHDTRT